MFYSYAVFCCYFFSIDSLTVAWVPHPVHRYVTRHAYSQSRMIQHGKPDRKSYQFGDLTRGFIKKSQEKVNEVTGNDDYTFGDLSKWADGKAKERITKLRNGTTSSDGYSYQLGDISSWAKDLVKEKAAQYAGKQGSEDYVLGDVSRTIFARVRSGEYTVDDVYLALRVLATAGFSVLPVANLLPVKLLLQLIEVDLAKDIGGRLTGAIATSVDARIKKAVTGDANYQLGDISKNKLDEALNSFTGKDSYQFGDISKTILARGKNKDQNDHKGTLTFGQLPDDLSDWDSRFLQRQHENDKGK